MHHTLRRDKSFLWLVLSLMLALAASAMMQPRAIAQTQKQGQGKADESSPIFHEYKGVALDMTTEETRKKLGTPTDKDTEQDFFMFNETESAQVFYDKTHKVMAISVNYLGDGSNVPKPKAVLGTEIEAKPDGSMYQLIRYPKAGCWVSYSRTGGDSPLITVTIQKLNN